MSISEELIENVWLRANAIEGCDHHVWRKDEFGAWIKRSEYNNCESPFGWEIYKISSTGPTISLNCKPLQWQNKIAKSDNDQPYVKSKRQLDPKENFSI